MAGIGFELKKLFRKDGLVNNVKAALYSTVVTVGPTLTTIATILIFNGILKKYGASAANRDLFQVTIMYAFVFSLILTSGYSMVLTRYVSDKIYEEKYDDLKASFYGSIAVIVGIASLIGLIFYSRSTLSFTYKFFAYIIFIENIVQVILSTYVTALKNVKRIVISFVTGFGVSIILTYILVLATTFDPIYIAVACVAVGLFIIILMLYYEIQKHFKECSDKYFEFLGAFKKYHLLFIVNVFYTLGLYIHNFMFWTDASVSSIIYQTFIYAPDYDVVAFYAYLSTLPTTILFVVKVETEFFDKYKRYFYCINGGAAYKDIDMAKSEMKTTLFRELIQLMSIQLIFTLGFIVVGNHILGNFGFNTQMLGTFNMLVLAYYLIAVIFIIMTLLLYFDDRNGALKISGAFLITNGLLTYMTLGLGNRYYGSGVFLASFITIIVAVVRLIRYINNIDYYVFCKNSAWSE